MFSFLLDISIQIITWAMCSENVPSGDNIFENRFAFVLNWIWGMRNCSKTDPQVIIVCQKLHLAKVTQEKNTALPEIARISALHCSAVS